MFGRFWRRQSSERDEREATFCERLCQLPSYLSGERSPFVPDPTTGVARLQTVSIKSPLRQREEEEANNLSRYLLEGETDETSQNHGEICSICTIHEATHYSLPCKHVACKVCWSRWLCDHNACMTCAGRVEHIKRFSLSLVPLALYETELEVTGKNNIQACTALVEHSLERCIRSMLTVKDSFGTLAENFHTVESHLIGITRPDPGTRVTIDSLTSVLAVERSSVLEQLDNYEKIFRPGQCWNTMDQEIHSLTAAVRSFSQVLDTMLEEKQQVKAQLSQQEQADVNEDALETKRRKDGQVQENGDDRDQSEDHSDETSIETSALSAALDVFEVLVAPTSVVAQWERVNMLLDSCGPSNHLIPGIVRVFGMIHFASLPSSDATDSGGSISSRAESVMRDAQQRSKSINAALMDELIPEAQVNLQRLRSMM